ncbi:MAG: prepilin-type N-terminal cleavage/methylation domain-containing protein [Phycisphaeraceae bacterium]|nr:prepilin-type N-terminal cleavage/methylation domain-containing protein [Phycisphaeraceae bacterium]
MASNLMQSARRGLTMLELMIVVAVLGIIGAMAVPMFSATDATRLTSAASVLAADIDAARAESIAHSDDTRLLVLDNDGLTWHIAAASDSTTPINHPTTGQPYRRSFGTGELKQLQGVTIDSYSLDTASETNDNKLGFGIYGQTDQTSDAAITLRSGDTVLTLTVNPSTGEVTIGQVN